MTTQEKRGAIHGGALTEEVLDSSRGVLQATRGSSQTKGLQQYFTPPEAADFIARVIGEPSAVLDPTAGSGALLCGFAPSARFGIEIDADHAGGSELAGTHYRPIAGDAQDVVPMLRAAGLQWPAVVLNPPFGLPWRDAAHSGKEISSTTLSFLWALDLLGPFGQGALVCGTERLRREVLGHPDAEAIYAVADVEGPLFEGVSLPVSIAFFLARGNAARKEGIGGLAELRLRASAPADGLGGLVEDVRAARDEAALYPVSPSHGASRKLAEPFDAAGSEHARRLKEAARGRPRHDVSLRGGRVHVAPSAYAQVALAEKHRLAEVRSLHRHNPSYFGQNGRAWRELEGYANDRLITISDPLRRAAEAALEEAETIATPLFPVPEVMRLGWLSELDRIRCIKDDPEKGYVAGKDYALATDSKVLESTEKRVVENRLGRHELRRFTKQRKVLRVRIGNHTFDESNGSIAYVARHFHLPDPGCVATRYPEKVARNRRVLDDVSRENSFSLYGYQADHLGRLLVKGRGLLAHDPGTGKTVQGMCLAEATPRIYGGPNQALFVIPQDLTLQWLESARRFFGRTPEVIRSPAHAREVARRVRAGEEGWWLAHYEMLCLVGRKDEDSRRPISTPAPPSRTGSPPTSARNASWPARTPPRWAGRRSRGPSRAPRSRPGPRPATPAPRAARTPGRAGAALPAAAAATSTRGSGRSPPTPTSLQPSGRR